MSPDVAAPEARRRSGRATLAALVAALVVLGAVAVGVHRWTHPHLFPSYAGDVGVVPRDVTRAAESFSVIFPESKGGSEIVVLNAVRARWSTNTARATATFWICHRSAGESPVGATHAPAEDCHDMVPVTPGVRFQYGPWPGHDYLFVTLTPTVPGVAHLTGVDVGYRRGADHLFQHGVQTIEMNFKVTAR